jgi:hypothetical protein
MPRGVQRRSRGAALAAGITLLALGGCVSPAQGRGGAGEGAVLQGSRVLLAPGGLLFAAYDADGDGSVSEAEREAGVSMSFARADVDRSGGLRIIELDAWRERVLGAADRPPSASAFDINFDGNVTPEEFSGALERLAAELDTNGDGDVGFDELALNAALLGPGPTGGRGIGPVDVGVRPPRIPQ